MYSNKNTYVKFPTAIDTLVIGAFVITIVIWFCVNDYWSYKLPTIGIIWSSVIGMAFGSYATSAVARIPKNKVFKDRPYCMNCKTRLAPRDLYPIFSYIINKRHCRFCHYPIPSILFYTETSVAITYILSYIYYGFSMNYILISFLLTGLIILIAMIINDRYFSKVVLTCCIVIGFIWYLSN